MTVSCFLCSHIDRNQCMKHKMSQRKGSLIWIYFDKVNKDKSKCKSCHKQFSTSSGTTSSLKNHLDRFHPVSFNELSKAQKEKNETEKAEKDSKQNKRKHDEAFPDIDAEEGKSNNSRNSGNKQKIMKQLLIGKDVMKDMTMK